MVIRRYTFALLTSLLVILAGFGGESHACVGLHCGDHMQSAEHSAAVKSIPEISAQSSHHDTDNADTGECNPLLCQAVVLISQNSQVVWNQYQLDREFQIGSQSKLTEPDSPYRPPDL